MALSLRAQFTSSPKPADSLPVIFQIGEKTPVYEALLPRYDHLLSVCHQDLKKAGQVWGSMLLSIYDQAEDLNINLDGVQLLLHVFWTPEGKIERLGYFVKPNSKPVEISSLQNLFNSFILAYTSSVQADVPYANYGVAGFPPLALKITASKQ